MQGNVSKLRSSRLKHMTFTAALLVSQGGVAVTICADDAVRVDLYGDPLPASAAVRLGTARFRAAGIKIGLAFAEDDRTLVVSSHERLTLIDVATGKRMREIAPKMQSRSVMLTPDRRTAVLFGAERNFRGAELRDIETVQRFDLVSGKMLSKFPVNDHFGEAIAIAPDGRTACTGANSGMLSVWDLFTGKELTSHKLGNALVNAVTISADGELLIAGTTEGLYFWKRSERLAGKAPVQIDEGRRVQAMPA